MLLNQSGLDGFLPIHIGVNSWYDTLNPLGDNSTPTDGSALSLIKDLGLNGNDVSQASGSAQPIFKRSIINNNHVFRVDGTKVMSAAGGPGNNYNGPLTVLSIADTTQTSATTTLCGKSASWVHSMDDVAQFRFTTPSIMDYDTTNAQYIANTFLVQTARFNSDFSVDFWKNRSFIQNVGGTTAMPSSTGPLYLFASNSTPTFAWNGDVIAFCIFFRALTNAEIMWMLNWASNRIGV